MLRLIGVYGTLKLNIRPSEFAGIEEDEYTCFCFDEAFAFIISKLKEGEEPIVHKNDQGRAYSKPSDYYKKFEGGG